jgi:hypothetical protein
MKCMQREASCGRASRAKTKASGEEVALKSPECERKAMYEGSGPSAGTLNKNSRAVVGRKV